eukprot:scaffold909_cov121-Isochrysis_galbana.AAC.6
MQRVASRGGSDPRTAHTAGRGVRLWPPSLGTKPFPTKHHVGAGAVKGRRMMEKGGERHRLRGDSTPETPQWEMDGFSWDRPVGGGAGGGAKTAWRINTLRCAQRGAGKWRPRAARSVATKIACRPAAKAASTSARASSGMPPWQPATDNPASASRICTARAESIPRQKTSAGARGPSALA